MKKERGRIGESLGDEIVEIESEIFRETQAGM